MRMASARRSPYSARSRARSPSGSAGLGTSRLGLPTSAAISFSSATIFRIASWPRPIASSISSSETSEAPASTMTTASSEPATTRSSRLVSSCWNVGFRRYSPSAERPTRTAAIGTGNGMSEMARANDAPVMARTSESFAWSADRTRPMTCVSHAHPSGKSGRSGRSIIREVRTSFSFGRPSRRKNPPGILPAAYVFSR